MEIKELKPKYTLEEFLEEEKLVEYPLEYVGGYIYPKIFTSMKHNKIITKISTKLENYFEDKTCLVFSEQIEVILGSDRVKPDLFIVCKNKDAELKTKGQSIITIPSLVFEVVSPRDASLDTITKMELYAKFGIKEYNLIYQEGTIHQYKLNEYGDYYLNKSYGEEHTYKSLVFGKLEFEISRIFNNL